MIGKDDVYRPIAGAGLLPVSGICASAGPDRSPEMAGCDSGGLGLVTCERPSNIESCGNDLGDTA